MMRNSNVKLFIGCITLYLCVNYSVFAQSNSYFNLSDSTIVNICDLIKIPSGYIYSCSELNTGVPSNSIGYVKKMDLQGNIVNSIAISHAPVGSSMFGSIGSNSTGLSVSVTFSVTSNGEITYLSKLMNFDFNLQQNWELQFVDSINSKNSYSITSVYMSQNGETYAYGTYSVPSTFGNAGYLFASKIDALGNKLWLKKYSFNHNVISNNFASLPDGSLILLYKSYPTGNASGDYRIMRVDSTGNVMWDKQVSHSYFLPCAAPEISLLSDQSVLVACDIAQQGDDFAEGHLIKVNFNGDVVSDKVFIPTSGNITYSILPSQHEENDDGTVIISAIRQDVSTGLYSSKNCIALLTPTFDTVWTRSYDFLNQNICTNFSAIKPTSDNGYIISGSGTVYSGQQIYSAGKLIKTDCNGAEGVLYPLKQPCYYYDCTQHPVYANFTSDKVYADTGEVIQFSNSSPNTTNRAWYFGDDSVAYTDANVQHAFSEYGTYQVKLITYHSMCSDTSVQTIQIGNTLGVSEYAQSSNGLKIYPNPSNGNFTVELENNKAATLSITDMLGRTIKMINWKKESNFYHVEGLSEGVYLLQVSYDNAQQEVKRIVVNH